MRRGAKGIKLPRQQAPRAAGREVSLPDFYAHGHPKEFCQQS